MKFGKPINGPKKRKKLSRKERIKKLENRFIEGNYRDTWDLSSICKAIFRLDLLEIRNRKLEELKSNYHL